MLTQVPLIYYACDVTRAVLQCCPCTRWLYGTPPNRPFAEERHGLLHQDGDQSLSPEVKEVCKELCSLVDIDQDGVVCDTELIRFVRVTDPGRFPPHGDRRDLPSELQKLCGASVIEFRGWIHSVHYVQNPLTIHSWIEKLRMEATFDRLIRLMDVNADGALSESEVVRFSNVCLDHHTTCKADLPSELERLCDAPVSQFRALIKRAPEHVIQEYIANMELCLRLEAISTTM